MGFSGEESLFVTKEPPRQNDDNYDEDDVSVTSTIEEDGEEFEVSEVLAERPDPADSTRCQYLIRWEGYPLDQCTWEPLKNLGEGVLQGWEETKKEISLDKRKPFDVAIFDNAFAEAQRIRAQRHMRRDAKRRRLGWTVPDNVSDEDDGEIEEDDDHNEMVDEDQEEGEITEEVPAGKPLPALSSIRGNEIQGIGSTSKSAATSAARMPMKQKTFSAKGSIEATPRIAEAIRKPETTTRYQGTAKAPKGQPARPMTSNTDTSKRRASIALSNSAPSVTAASNSSSSLRSKFSGKTAIRSRPVSNIIMPGEKAHRSRKRLEEKMGDPSLDPKPFHSMRVMNIARKKGIEKGDAAPRDVSTIPAHFLLTNDRTDSGPQKKPRQNKANPGIAPKDPDATPSGSASTKKGKKAVRFTGADEPLSAGEAVVASPEEMMDIDHDTTSHRKLSLETYQARTRMHSSEKICSFGPSGSTEVVLVFEGVPYSAGSWVNTFISEKALHFDRECMFADVFAKRGALISNNCKVSDVRATSTENTVFMENVAANLQQECTALFLLQPRYSVLVFPSAVSRWFEATGPPSSSDSARSVLQYAVFENNAKPQILRHIHPSTSQIANNQPNLIRLFQDILCLDHTVLRPRNPAEKGAQIFMLCFSEENHLLCQYITIWLCAVHTECRIYLYDSQGAWKSFIKEIRSAPGTLIFDEILTPRIRRFPKIWELADGGRCMFWCLATGESRNPPRCPSDSDILLAPSQYQLTLLFPHGRVFLLTPSFIVTNPHGLCEFLMWFNDWAANPGCMVVTGYDFPTWLRDLVQEKVRQLETDEKRAADDLFDDKTSRSLQEQRQDLEDWKKAYTLWQKVTDKYGNQDTSEYIRRVTWAPQQIHPSDEQSLVNWFLWWSLQRLDHHQRFIIIGSHERHGSKASLKFRIPNYPVDMFADPDAEEVEVDKVIAYQREAQIAAWKQKYPEATEIVKPGHDVVAVSSEPSFSGDVLFSDRADEVTACLSHLNKKLGHNWSRIYERPVSYLDLDMADHFEDPECSFATFKQWLFSHRPFNKISNTWLGLFYTIDGRWDGGKPAKQYFRRPWIAVYRPINPQEHYNGYAAMELFIWDFMADLDHGKNPELSCLLDMQARLVDFVGEEAAREEVPDYYLKRVWLGGRTDLELTSTEHHLEITCRQLENMARNGKSCVPVYPAQLRSRGWVPIDIRLASKLRSDLAVSQIDLAREPFPKCAADYDLPEQIVFHPLRSQASKYRTERRKLSKYFNDMYAAAFEARRRDPACLTAELHYRPTTQWYADLREEKRHANHVCVDTWEKISSRLNNARQKKA